MDYFSQAIIPIILSAVMHKAYATKARETPLQWDLHGSESSGTSRRMQHFGTYVDNLLIADFSGNPKPPVIIADVMQPAAAMTYTLFGLAKLTLLLMLTLSVFSHRVNPTVFALFNRGPTKLLGLAPTNNFYVTDDVKVSNFTKSDLLSQWGANLINLSRPSKIDVNDLSLDLMQGYYFLTISARTDAPVAAPLQRAPPASAHTDAPAAAPLVHNVQTAPSLATSRSSSRILRSFTPNAPKEDYNQHVFALLALLAELRERPGMLNSNPVDTLMAKDLHLNSIELYLKTKRLRSLFDVLNKAEPLRSPFVDIKSPYFPRYVDDDIPSSDDKIDLGFVFTVPPPAEILKGDPVVVPLDFELNTLRKSSCFACRLRDLPSEHHPRNCPHFVMPQPPTDDNTDDVAQPTHKESVNILHVARNPYVRKDKTTHVFTIDLIDDILPDLVPFEINYESNTSIEIEPLRSPFDVLDEAEPLPSPFVDIKTPLPIIGKTPLVDNSTGFPPLSTSSPARHATIIGKTPPLVNNSTGFSQLLTSSPARHASIIGKTPLVDNSTGFPPLSTTSPARHAAIISKTPLVDNSTGFPPLSTSLPARHAAIIIGKTPLVDNSTGYTAAVDISSG
ncbi:hypothetical protein T492DRAFT_866915 [Pavlovales sp. CCMP2436]|nr:hypothetical protein T492DRAFT_866915 [Pavlovales sp. CCMP2436]